MNRRAAVQEAADRVAAFLNARHAGHDLKGDFALLRNGAELWARDRDRREESAASRPRREVRDGD